MHAFVDSHSHLDVSEFDADRAEVIARARAVGVATQIIPGVIAQDWEKLRAICKQHDGLHAAYGLHPTFLEHHRPEFLSGLRTWIEREKPCAIGECGLDYFVEGLDLELQRNYFQRQLELAREYELPVIVHVRRAVDDVLGMLRRIGGLRGVLHSWSGSDEQARQAWKLGFHLGIGGPVTYERAKRLRHTVATMPLEWLLLETDSPDQPLCTHRGQRNEPALMVDVARSIAQLRGVELDDIAAATTANARVLFGLP